MEKYKERIDKIIASTGIMSRRDVKKAAAKQRIHLNDAPVKDVSIKATEADTIMLDGKPIEYKRFIYVMMNKPKGYVCSTDDPSSPIVNVLLREQLQHLNLFSIGRLDKNTTGLVILTNDGVLAHDLISPSKHVYKKYYFETKRALEDGYAERFKSGITLEDGSLCRPAIYESTSENSGYLTICEGKFHQIKRMFLSLGNEITELHRVSIGAVSLDNTLKYADYRLLTEEEINSLKR